MENKVDKNILLYNAATGQFESIERVEKTDKEWQKILTPEEFDIMRKQGTERAFTGKYWNNKRHGIYKCMACGTDLFKTDTKFESGTGWPSFWQPVSEKNVVLIEDNSLGIRRVEVRCARCGAHLGHVFDDGPPPTHQRYCMNSAALKFIEKKK